MGMYKVSFSHCVFCSSNCRKECRPPLPGATTERESRDTETTRGHSAPDPILPDEVSLMAEREDATMKPSYPI